jgi:hypothetical protein
MSAYDQMALRRRVLLGSWLGELAALPIVIGIVPHYAPSAMRFVFYSWLVAAAITGTLFARALRCPVCHKNFPTGFRPFPRTCPCCKADFVSVGNAASII